MFLDKFGKVLSNVCYKILLIYMVDDFYNKMLSENIP